MNFKHALALAVSASILSFGAYAAQIGGPIVVRDPPPVSYVARSYYKITIVPGTAANGWVSTYAYSSTSSSSTQPGCADAIAVNLAYIASHGYIYQNYSTCI